MKILIFGAGAVGQGVGGLLAAAGHKVTFLLRPRYSKVLASQGLLVDGIFGDHRIPSDQMTLISNAEEPADTGFDLVLVSVKAYDTAASIPRLQHILEGSPEAAVVSMQNGYGNAETLSEAFGKTQVLAARVITGFTIPEPGRVTVTVHASEVAIGSFWQKAHENAAILAEALTAAGLPSRAVDNIEAVLWGKILYNCALNPLGALLDLHYGALAENASTRSIMESPLSEAFDVIHAYAFPCLWQDRDAFLEAFYGQQVPPTSRHRSSMLQDLQAGKPTEIDALNGALLRLGRAKGLSLPANQMMTNLVRAREAFWADQESDQN